MDAVLRGLALSSGEGKSFKLEAENLLGFLSLLSPRRSHDSLNLPLRGPPFSWEKRGGGGAQHGRQRTFERLGVKRGAESRGNAGNRALTSTRAPRSGTFRGTCAPVWPWGPRALAYMLNNC